MNRMIVLILALAFVFSGAMIASASELRMDEPKSQKKADKSKSDSKPRDADKDDDDADDDDDEAPPAKDSPKDKPAEKAKEPAKETTADVVKKKDEPARKGPTIKRLMEVKLDQYIVAAKAINLPLPGRVRTIRELLERFEKWSKDDEIGAVMLNLDGVSLAIPDVEEVRAGLQALRKGGKKVVAFLNAGDDMGYLLACTADEIAVAPTGNVAVPGIGRLFPFMRGMYQLRGIEFDVITAGRFKYPGFLNAREPNKYFKEEIGEILDGWFNEYVSYIAEGRKLSQDAVRQAIDVALFDAQEAKNRGLVDVIAYYEDYAERVVKRNKFKKVVDGESDFSHITSLNDLINAYNTEVRKAQKSYEEVGPKIAVLHARGPIVDVSLGAGLSSSLIMRDDFVKVVDDLRKNKSIRAVVLRIDSPGGSGYASDVIWQKLRALDEEKPLVVSMGTVAGSGGYYIACPGRTIYAEPSTITGSIGVLAILPNQASAINRMDVSLAEMKRGERSLLGMGHRDLPPVDRDFIQKYLLDFYEVFLDRVAQTRRMPKDQVRKLAEGRIYTGRQAVKIGLVDKLGTLADAIGAAREMANIPPSAEIKLVHYPRPSSLGELLFEGMGGVSLADVGLARITGPAPAVSFDRQVQFFGQRPQPLCWMATPCVEGLTQNAGAMQSIQSLLGLPQVGPELIPRR